MLFLPGCSSRRAHHPCASFCATVGQPPQRYARYIRSPKKQKAKWANCHRIESFFRPPHSSTRPSTAPQMSASSSSMSVLSRMWCECINYQCSTSRCGAAQPLAVSMSQRGGGEGGGRTSF